MWYKEAFTVLSLGRPNGDAGVAISIGDMIQYFREFDSPFPIDISCSIIVRIDSKYRDLVHKKRKAADDLEKKRSKLHRR